jgi:DNA-binding protein HU-beta
MVTQSQFENNLKEALAGAGWDLSKKEIVELLDVTGRTVADGLRVDGSVRVRGVGLFNAKKVPATKARKGINPFTKEEQMFKAKPASTKVKVRPAKEITAALGRKK